MKQLENLLQVSFHLTFYINNLHFLETGVVVAKAYGQYSTPANQDELVHGCDILCATPGRLKHFLATGYIDPKLIRFLVLGNNYFSIKYFYISVFR